MKFYVKAAVVGVEEEPKLVRREIAENTSDEDVLLSLSTDNDPNVRIRVSENPYAPVEALEILSKDSEGSIRMSVARNPNTPISIIKEFLKDTDFVYLHRAVAKKPNLPAEILDELADDKDTSTVLSVASHPNTSFETLLRMASESRLSVRFALAQYQSNPELLKLLAKDKNPMVRGYVVENPNTPDSVLKEMLNDSSPTVQMFAKIRFKERFSA